MTKAHKKNKLQLKYANKAQFKMLINTKIAYKEY